MRLRLNLVLVVATFAVGLLVDRFGGLAGQLAVGVWTWGLMFRLLGASPKEWRLPMWVCLVWATFGEIFLSLVWGLYTYRLENIPFFIPPGHVLLFWLGLTLASRVPAAFVLAVPVSAVGYAAFAWAQGIDSISILLVALFVLCTLQGAALAVELYGTWLGNWVWHPTEAYFGLTSANPPLAAGSFYCMLDVLVGLTVRGIVRRMRSLPLVGARAAG
jgi:hypothetical protein